MLVSYNVIDKNEVLILIENFDNYETSQMLKDRHCLIYAIDLKCPQQKTLWKQKVGELFQVVVGEGVMEYYCELNKGLLFWEVSNIVGLGTVAGV